MQQQISVITLATRDRATARRFYIDGFGWTPVFENDEIVFFQMNGLMLGLWSAVSMAEDMKRQASFAPGAYALAHNLPTKDAVQPLLDKLAAAGGRILRNADAPPQGGMRGYIADPDGHAWEIAWNPAWTMDAEGHVTFGV